MNAMQHEQQQPSIRLQDSEEDSRVSNTESVSPAEVAREIFDDGITYDLRGESVPVSACILKSESEFMAALIKERKLQTCVETGAAFGGATLTICKALSELESASQRPMHFAIDPLQYNHHYRGTAVAAVRRCGLAHLLEFMEGPSHLMMPRLLERGIRADMVFVDGMHTFDYKLIDVFMADKLLRIGGILMMHDLPMRSTQKVVKYLAAHRRYRRLPGPAKRPLVRRILSGGKQTLSRFDPVLGFSYLVRENLFVAEKLDDFDPPHDFFRQF